VTEVKNYEVEPLNYTDTSRLIEAFTKYLGMKEGAIGTYNLELLRKLERNKRILYDTPTGSDACENYGGE
jgi:hypothetical protein